LSGWDRGRVQVVEEGGAHQNDEGRSMNDELWQYGKVLIFSHVTPKGWIDYS
jgi:hypothetical protein